MKVEPLSTVRSSKPRRSERTKSAGPGSFAEVLADKTAAPSSAPAGTALGAVDSLLALQEVPDATARRREAKRRGESLLEQLDEIRLDLLSGTLSRKNREAGPPRGSAERSARCARTGGNPGRNRASCGR